MLEPKLSQTGVPRGATRLVMYAIQTGKTVAYVKLFSKNSYILFIPILTGLFDLSENIQSVIMNLNYASLDESQVSLASLTTSLKWLFVALMILILVFGIFQKKFTKRNL